MLSSSLTFQPDPTACSPTLIGRAAAAWHAAVSRGESRVIRENIVSLFLERSVSSSGFDQPNCLLFQIMLPGNPSLLREDVLSPNAEATLREALKRCSPATWQAACAYRKTGDVDQIPAVVLGVIERFVERDLRPKIQHPSAAELRLIEDLNVDSLTMLEAILLLEEVLQITIDNDELQALRTLGDVQRFTECKLRRLPSTEPGPANPLILSRSLEQRTLGDHPRRICDGTDLAKNMKSTGLE